MSTISSAGQFRITMSEDHLNPVQLMQQFEYDQMFSMSIESSSSGKVTYQNRSGYRLLQEDEDENKEVKKLKFTAHVVAHSSKEILFQMVFENSQLVSEISSEYDRFLIRVRKAYLFRSRNIYKTVSTDCEQENCFIDFDKVIPPQISDLQMGKMIDDGL